MWRLTLPCNSLTALAARDNFSASTVMRHWQAHGLKPHIVRGFKVSRDPQFVESYMSQRERILSDGAIPAKYKHLMTMIVDALQSHPDGVATIANRARSAGASEAEIQEAVEVAYLFGGTPALVTATNAFRTA